MNLNPFSNSLDELNDPWNNVQELTAVRTETGQGNWDAW